MNGYTNRDVIITGISADSNTINLAAVTLSAGATITVELTTSYDVDVTDVIYGSTFSYLED